MLTASPGAAQPQSGSGWLRCSTIWSLTNRGKRTVAAAGQANSTKPNVDNDSGKTFFKGAVGETVTRLARN